MKCVKTILTTLLLGYFAAANAQEFILPNGTSIFDKWEGKWLLGAQAGGLHQSNALPNSIANAFLFGGEIDEEMKDALSANMNPENQLGWNTHLAGSVTYRPLGKRMAFTLHVGATTVQHSDFTNDAADLVFRGNAHFGESPINLSGLTWQQQRHQKLQLGIVDSKTGSFVRAGLYRGMGFEDWSTEPTTLQTVFTSSGGNTFAERIILSTQGFEGNMASRTADSQFTGVGFGLDANFVKHFDFGTLMAGVSDLGLMRWNQMERRDTAGVFEFGGFDYDLGSSPDNLLENLLDSIRPAVRTKQNVWQTLPTRFMMGYISPVFFKKFFASANATFSPGFNQNIRLSLAGYYTFQEEGFLWASLSLSNHALAQLGIGAQKTFFKKALLGVFTPHLPGLFSKNATSRGLSIQWIQRI